MHKGSGFRRLQEMFITTTVAHWTCTEPMAGIQRGKGFCRAWYNQMGWNLQDPQSWWSHWWDVPGRIDGWKNTNLYHRKTIWQQTFGTTNANMEVCCHIPLVLYHYCWMLMVQLWQQTSTIVFQSSFLHSVEKLNSKTLKMAKCSSSKSPFPANYSHVQHPAVHGF